MNTLIIITTSIGFVFTIEKTTTIPMPNGGCEEVAKVIHQVNENTIAYCIGGENNNGNF